MNASIEETLQAAGYLSSDQLARHFGTRIETVPIRPWMVRTHDGLWNAAVRLTGRHTRHRALVTEIYLVLHESLATWTIAPSHDGGPSPDALLTVHGEDWTIALEADTGAEHRPQWDEKLARYRLAPSHWHLLALTTGKTLRQRRMSEWLAESSPIPWMVCDMDRLIDFRSWTWIEPERIRDTPPRARRTRYQVDGTPISADTAERALSTGQWVVQYRERCHGCDVVAIRTRGHRPSPLRSESF
jgi:hypothetical protein